LIQAHLSILNTIKIRYIYNEFLLCLLLKRLIRIIVLILSSTESCGLYYSSCPQLVCVSTFGLLDTN